jgi:predicted O-methyltransferase YrrM
MTEDQFVKKSDSLEILDQIKSASPGLHQTTLDVLSDMYGADELYGTESDGPVSIDKIVRISIDQGAIMNELMRANAVERSLEVGFGYGFSTIWMLDALRSRNNSLHIAIDPWEKTWCHGIGLIQVKRLAFYKRFKWIQNFSVHALSGLIQKNEKFDFVFIDGGHRFDDVIVDFYLADQLVRPGAIIALDDMWMNAVRTATNFILNNRAYELILQPAGNMTVLRKKRDDDRDWAHFNNFEVHGF